MSSSSPSLRIYENWEGPIKGNASSTGNLFRQKMGCQGGKSKRGNGANLLAIVYGNGLPTAGRTESATPAKVTLVEDTLNCLWVPGYSKPVRDSPNNTAHRCLRRTEGTGFDVRRFTRFEFDFLAAL